MYPSLALELSLPLHLSNRGMPFPYPNSWIVQQPAQASGTAHQLDWTRDLPSNTAQIDQTALVDDNDHPGNISYLGYPLSKTQFPRP